MANQTKKSYNFTDGQDQVLDKLTTWFNDPKQLIATLEGYAGTGKTYLSKYFLNNVVKKGACITAPTHKALHVLEKATDRKGKTLHSLLGLRLNTNLDTFNIDNIKFDLLGTEYIKDFIIINSDECSQISTPLFKLLVERSRFYNTKILFMGDSCQLPPVKENISPTFLVPNKYLLTEIIRQNEGNPLLKLATLLRYDIQHNTFTLLSYLQNKPEEVNSLGEGYSILHKESYQELVLDQFKTFNSDKDISKLRIGAYTNNNILAWNTFVRNNTISDAKEILTSEDIITGYQTIVDANNNPFIINSEDYKIESIQSRLSDDGFKCFGAQIRNLYDDSISTINVVDHTDKQGFYVFTEKLKHLHRTAFYSKAIERGSAWKRYFEYKNSNLVMIDFKLFYDGRDRGTVSKDLDYSYCLTVHKLQGSTIDTMFINALDILYDKNGFPYSNGNLINKLLYTGITRASKKVNILL